ncbi:hypothetical protein P3L10_032527 [Capsicum annuum]
MDARNGGSSISTSLSIDSATTAASQNMKFKEVLEYDNYGMLIIIHDGDGQSVDEGLVMKKKQKPFSS